jgi:hypothetical protein
MTKPEWLPDGHITCNMPATSYYFLHCSPHEASIVQHYSHILQARQSSVLNPEGERIFWPIRPPSLLYNKYRVSFPEVVITVITDWRKGRERLLSYQTSKKWRSVNFITGDRWNIWFRGSLVNGICNDSHVHQVVRFEKPHFISCYCNTLYSLIWLYSTFNHGVNNY